MILDFGGRWTDLRQGPKGFATLAACVLAPERSDGVDPTATGEVETGTRRKRD